MPEQHPKPGGDDKVTPIEPAPGVGEAAPESEVELEEKHATAPGGGDRGNGNKPDGGGGTKIGIADEQPLGGGGAPKLHDVAQSGGGSSPVVPILIAVAVLAALSIGAVIYRQRRQIPVG